MDDETQIIYDMRFAILFRVPFPPLESPFPGNATSFLQVKGPLERSHTVPTPLIENITFVAANFISAATFSG